MKMLQQTSSSKQTKLSLGIIGFTTAALLYCGLCGCLFDAMISAAAGQETVFLTLGGIAVLLLYVFAVRFRIGRIFLYILFAGLFTASLFLYDLPSGLCSLFNQLSGSIAAHLGRNMTLLNGNDAALGIAVFWLSVVLLFLCAHIVLTQNALVAWALGLLFFILFLGLDYTLSPVWTVSYVCGLIFLRMPLRAQTKRNAGSLPGTILFLCLPCLILFAGIRFFSGYSFSPVHKAHNTWNHLIDAWRFGEKTTSGLPEGDFRALGSLVQTDSPMLQVSMSDPDSYYLRGFIGSRYTDSSWNEPDPVSLYDGADLFYWMHQADFYGTTQLSDIAALLNEASLNTSIHSGDSDSYDVSNRIQVEHLGARTKYTYLPYETSSTSLLDPDLIGDIRISSLQPRGNASYQAETAHNLVKRYATLSAMLMSAEKDSPSADLSEYLALESHYRAFVYRHFLDVPEELSDFLKNELGDPTPEENQKHVPYNSAKQEILSWLGQNISYGEVIAAHDPDRDFLMEFLTDTKIGYDVHYASAAVMMMRYLGIPARYVEGYLITPDTAADAKPDLPFTLTEQDSHAWIEYYQDGIGWIPFEVTPKYQNLMEQEDLLFGTASEGSGSSSNSSSTSNPNESSLEMNHDFFEDLPEEEEPEKPDIITPIIQLIVKIAFSLLLVLLISFLLWKLFRYWQKQRSFRLKDRKEAVKHLYTELHRLMGLLYHWEDCTLSSFYIETLRADLGDNMCALYESVLEICERAAFSSHPISEEDYRLVYQFVRRTRLLKRKRSRKR